MNEGPPGVLSIRAYTVKLAPPERITFLGFKYMYTKT